MWQQLRHRFATLCTLGVLLAVAPATALAADTQAETEATKSDDRASWPSVSDVSAMQLWYSAGLYRLEPVESIGVAFSHRQDGRIIAGEMEFTEAEYYLIWYSGMAYGYHKVLDRNWSLDLTGQLGVAFFCLPGFVGNSEAIGLLPSVGGVVTLRLPIFYVALNVRGDLGNRHVVYDACFLGCHTSDTYIGGVLATLRLGVDF